jgi:hypothetical protein
MPPHGRNWKGSVVAPFAGSNMLVLYQCPRKTSDNSKASGGHNNSYFIQVLHNEIPVSMPVRQLPIVRSPKCWDILLRKSSNLKSNSTEKKMLTR